MEIVTNRLVLREFTEGDLAALLAYHADPRYTEFYGPEEAQPDRVRTLLLAFIQWATERPRCNYQFAIVKREEPQDVIGCCGVRGGRFDPGTAECGIELAPECWGHGFATEAMRAVLEFGFRGLGLEEVRGISVTANTRIARLVRRLGFTVVGERPGPAWMSTRGWNHTEWQITRERWEATAAI
jgi:ribosomal-protein-alanine N-acetyltransferase